MAPMALSDSKKQYDDLLVKLDDIGFKAATYKRGLATLEVQIIKYKEHEVLFFEEIALFKRSVGHKEYQMGLLRDELKKVKQEKEGFEFKIAKFEKSAKDLDQLLGSQITDKSKKEFKEPEVNEYGRRATTSCDRESDNSKENTDDPLKQHQMTDTESSSFKSPLKIDKDWKEKFFYPANHVSDDKDGVESPVVVKKKTVVPTIPKVNVVKSKQQEKPVRKPVKYAEMYRSQKPRGNQRNWNNLKSQQLGSDFVMIKKACYVCGSFEHLQYTCKHKRHVNDQKQVQKPIWNNARRVDHHNSHRMSYPHPKRNFVPKAVLMKTGMRPVNAANPKAAYNAVKRNRFNDVKASACWVWMPKNRVVDHVSKNISASVTLKRLDYIDAQGRFKSVMAWMDAQIQGRQECSKEKEESREECNKSRKTKKMKCLEESSQQKKRRFNSRNLMIWSYYCWFKITVVGEKVNAAESLLVVSTEVNAD
ncbi:hypothetical protein Tco_1387848 [Tanacetum coccineum]